MTWTGQAAEALPATGETEALSLPFGINCEDREDRRCILNCWYARGCC